MVDIPCIYFPAGPVLILYHQILEMEKQEMYLSTQSKHQPGFNTASFTAELSIGPSIHSYISLWFTFFLALIFYALNFHNCD